MQPGQLLGLLAQQVGAQEIGKQAVVAPFSLWGLARLCRVGLGVVDRGDEQVGGVELLEDAAAVAARVQGLAQRRIEVAQQAGAQQEIADLGALPVEHVFGQEVGDGAVAA